MSTLNAVFEAQIQRFLTDHTPDDFRSICATHYSNSGIILIRLAAFCSDISQELLKERDLFLRSKLFVGCAPFRMEFAVDWLS